MTRADAAELVAMLLTAFANSRGITEQTASVYERMLLDLDFEPASRAVARLVNTSKWLPTIAEIRSTTVEMQAGAKRLGGEAWGDVVEACRRVGSYQTPKFDDPLVAECVRMMGWRDLCLGQNDAADRARFTTLYEGLADRARKDATAGEALALPRSPGDRVKSLPGFSAIGAGGALKPAERSAQTTK